MEKLRTKFQYWT